MPNIIVLAQVVIQTFCCQGSIGLQCLGQKREIIQPNIHRISRKVKEVIYTLDTILVLCIIILAQAILQIFCWQDPLWVKCLSLKRGIIQWNIHRFFLWKVNQVIYIMYPNLYAWYHDPSSSGSPDVLLTKLLYCTKCQSQKREIIQPNIYRILSKVNQVIYTMATVYLPNIMILAQAVIQTFCLRGSLGLQCISRKREIISPNIHRILRKINQVIYTLDTIFVSNIMTLAQAVLQILCWQGPLWVKCLSEKGNNSVKYSQNFMKS